MRARSGAAVAKVVVQRWPGPRGLQPTCPIVIAVTTDDDAGAPEAYFTIDGNSYLPGVMARGPWGVALGGQAVGALLGWGIERSGIDEDFQPSRFTVDLLRPVLPEPVQIQTSVQREGRRIKLVDGVLVQKGKTVARASALFLRRGEHPDGQVWSASVEMPPLPTTSDGFPADMPFLIWGYGATAAGSPGIAAGEWEQSHSQKFAWTRLFRPIVQGHPLTPFTRLAFAGDVTSSLAHWGTSGLRYINADYTVTVSRLPDGEFVGLAAQSHYGTAGVATGSATLFDRHGPIGTSSALALAQPAEAFQPSRG
jgi:Thioesterase-like superfamily